MICVAQVPFVHGGAETLVDALAQRLKAAGHAVDVARVPCKTHPREELIKNYLTWRLLDLTESQGEKIDLVIATKYPTYAVRHPKKVTWLVHQLREAYDLFNTEYSDFRDDPADTRVRELIRDMDTMTIGESERIYAISRNVAGRLATHNGLRAEPLHPPPAHDGLYRNEGYEDYILCVSRLHGAKRVHLLIDAMAHVRSQMRCVVVGEGPEETRLKKLAAEQNVEGRVKFLGRVGASTLLDLYAHAAAVFYAPYDEDYGYVTVEAFKSGKPVITASDSGGVLEFVEDGLNGYVCSSEDPSEMAAKIDHLYAHRTVCRAMGEAGLERVQGLSWEGVVSRLVEGT